MPNKGHRETESEYAAIWVLKQKTWKKLIKQDERLKFALSIDITDVAAYIGFHTRATIADIVQHPYFASTSLSTIKRFVNRLKTAGIAKDSVGLDKRKRILSIK